MIAARFAAQVESDGARIALRTSERDWSYAELFERAQWLEEQLRPLAGQQIGIFGNDLTTRIIGLLAADLNEITPCLFPTGMSQAAMNEWAARLGLIDVFDPSQPFGDNSTSFATRPTERRRAVYLPTLWLFTSGTTGPPQPVRHTWQALTSTIHTGPRFQNRRWLIAYDPASFAGLQVTLQALLTGGTLSDVSQSTPEETARRIIAEQVEFASGTPTFWRMLLGAVNSSTWQQAALEQITLGGEAVSEGTLTALKSAFPQARISHIYATSELGVCFSVSDGHAGFPASYLQNPPAGCQLRISDEGELEVLSHRRAVPFANKMEPVAEPDQINNIWQLTGDLVELQDDRVYFVGRKSGVIQVGGGKVVPEEVEAIVGEVPGVAEVRVSGQASSVLGALVRADVVAAPDAEITAVRTAILAACQAQLPRHKVPAMIEFHTTLPRTSSGKLARSTPAEETLRPMP